MNKWFKVLSVALCGLSVTACSTTQIKEVSSARGTLVEFTEKVGEQSTRLVYLVHADVVRVDYGNGGSYTLFDRRTQTLYDVNARDETVTIIEGAKPILTEQELGLTITENESRLVKGGASTHFRFEKKGMVCLNVVGMSDLLPAVEVAIAEMATVRANDPRLADIDPQSCEYIVRIFANSKTEIVGLPVRQWNKDGYSKFMDTYQVQIDLEGNSAWYKLPEWY
ncbi:hypothetical protein MNBD_GAMMA18-1108 [hydrothermal vent metagenome]|uniref:DUF4412 domain-containing protein n=1 Tax=hydrothermal vent metagenome TaxID=652676 RepID=A0A3B0YZS3_9ZZZZ